MNVKPGDLARYHSPGDYGHNGLHAVEMRCPDSELQAFERSRVFWCCKMLQGSKLWDVQTLTWGWAPPGTMVVIADTDLRRIDPKSDPAYTTEREVATL